jgi:MtN3 and saliva related transmembrane protein
MNITFEIVGYLAGLCTAFCFMPQTIKTLRTHDVRSLSLLSYVFFTLGIILWTVYGIYLQSVQMIVFNLITLVFATSVLVMILKYKKNLFGKKAAKRKK